MTTIVFQPVLPLIQVTKIETEEQVKEIGEFLRTYHSKFVGLPYGFTAYGLRVHKKSVSIPSDEGRYDLFKIGSYLVTSENGLRYLTSNMVVAHGGFPDFPAELFTPIGGDKVMDLPFAAEKLPS